MAISRLVLLSVAVICIFVTVSRGQKNITIGTLLPVDGVAGSGLAGLGLRAAAEVALEEINSRQDILAGYKIVFSSKNTAPSKPGSPGQTMPERVGLATRAVAEWVQQRTPVIPMIYGSVLTPVVEASAFVSGSFNIIQVASVANSPTLTNKQQYPYFVSTASSPAALNLLVINFLKMNGWTRIGILTENVRPMPDISNALKMMLKGFNIEVVASYDVESKNSPSAALRAFQEKDVKIIISHTQHLMHLKVLCEAFKLKMHAPDYVWINNNLLWNDLKVHYDTQTGQNEDFGGCTYENVTEAAEGQFGTTVYDPIRRNDSQATIGGKTALEIWKGMEANLMKHNMTSDGLGHWALSGYDALWAMALAMNNSFSEEDTLTLDDFSYTDGRVSDLLVKGLTKVKFFGALGELKFDDRSGRSSLLTLDQISGGTARIVGLFDSTVKPPLSFTGDPSHIWKYFEGKAPKDRSAKRTLRLGVLLPLSAAGGRGVWAAAQVAVQQVNERDDLLPDYNLVLDLKNTAVAASNDSEAEQVYTAITKVVEFLKSDGPPVLMIYGGLKSSVTAATASISSAWNVVQVSPTATDPSLSNKKLYKYFLRTSLGGTVLNKLVLKLLKHNDWKRIAIISENTSPYSLMANDLQRTLKDADIEVVTTALLEDHGDPGKDLLQLKKQKVRIIIGQYFHKMHLKVLCAAYKNNMTSPNYVWIVNDMLLDDLSSQYERELKANPSLVDCSFDEIKMAANGQFATRGYEPKNDDDKVVYGGNKISDIWNAIIERMGETTAPEAMIGSYVLGGYDAIWSMAQALHNSIPKVAPERLEDFSYNHSNMTDVFFKEFQNLTFEGATGLVKFTSSGDRIGTLTLRQIKDGVSKEIAMFDVTKDSLTFSATEKDVWSAYGNKKLRDRDELREMHKSVPRPLFITFAVLAGLGCLVCLVYLLTTITVKTNSLVAGNWPVLSFLVIVGCMTLNVAVIIMGLDENTVSRSILTPLCQAGIFLLLIGFTLSYVSLVMKIFGIYNYFTSHRNGKKPMKEVTLAILVLLFIVFDLVILLPWQIIDPLLVKVRPLQQQEDQTQQIIYLYQVVECTSFNLTYWNVACLVYKGCVLLFGAVFTWPALIASHRRGSGGTDSSYLGLCVFVTVLLSVVGMPLVYTMQGHPGIQYGIAGGFILACSLLISVLQLVARGLLLRQGENVPARILAPFDAWLESIADDDGNKATGGDQEMVTSNGETNKI